MPRVSVAVALPDRQDVVELDLPEGSTVRDALCAQAVRALLPGVDPARVRVGIWSREVDLGTGLRGGDRVEVYRGLEADPKALRRARARLKPSPRSRSGP